MGILKYSESLHIDPEVGSVFQFVNSIQHTSPLHYHDFYEFFLITKGSCIHQVNNSRQNLPEGSLVFIRPDDTHYYEYAESTDCEFINIPCAQKAVENAFHYLEDPMYRDAIVNVKLPPYVTLSAIERVNLKERLLRLKTLATINKAQAKIQLKSLLVEIVVQYLPHIRNNYEKQLPLWLEALLTQMQKKENFTAGIPMMYSLCDRSRGHLNRAFKQYLDTTPTSYINQLRIHYAKSLLLTTNLSILDICLDAGFNNLSHFNHLFKHDSGVSPLKFRLMSKMESY